MAIFGCTNCDYLTELDNNYIGMEIKCPRCKELTTIYGTISYIKDLMKSYAIPTSSAHKVSSKNTPFLDIDIHNTDFLAQPSNTETIRKWFKQRNIAIDLDPSAADTTGFFDEIALKIGDNFETLNCVVGQIKYAQHKNHTTAKIDLSKKTQKEINLIAAFCQELHDYSFVARFTHLKKEKNIYLTIQYATKIKSFFDGLWMEWFVLIKLLYLFKEKNINPACTRSLKISFNETHSNELDLVIVSENDFPIVIECKSGEFRQDIDKYLSLRKRLGLDKTQFILCIFGLDEAQAKGMTSMYDLTIVNELSIFEHIKTIL